VVPLGEDDVVLHGRDIGGEQASTVSVLPPSLATRISAGLMVARHGPEGSEQRYFEVQ